MELPMISLPITTIPNVIYHYCGVQGFKGIIEGKAIWLSDVGYCNDYMEHNWLKEKYDLKIDFLRSQEPSAFHDALAAEKANYREHLAFLACFSTQSDLLSQWRAYAEDGAGFAIGFDPTYFKFSPTLPTYGPDVSVTCGLFPVCYDEIEQNQLIEQILDEYRQRSLLAPTPADLREVAEGCYFNLQMISIFCKNPAFKEENEWRIVYRPSISRGSSGLEVFGGICDIFFRTSKHNIIPYFKLSFAEERHVQPVTEIILGPKRCLTDECDVLSLFLERHGSSCGRLKPSSATYR